MQIETDNETWEQGDIYLIMCNGPREGGGFIIAPDAKIDDGIFHYAINQGRQPTDDVSHCT